MMKRFAKGLKVMDGIAFSLAREYNIPFCFNAFRKGSFLRAIQGVETGTWVQNRFIIFFCIITFGFSIMGSSKYRNNFSRQLRSEKYWEHDSVALAKVQCFLVCLQYSEVELGAYFLDHGYSSIFHTKHDITCLVCF